MKKVIFSAAIIATAFLSLAFTPIEENVEMDGFQTITEADITTAYAMCDRRYRTAKEFSVCDRITSDKKFQLQSEVLDKY